jgi:hypothetical protein
MTVESPYKHSMHPRRSRASHSVARVSGVDVGRMPMQGTQGEVQ